MLAPGLCATGRIDTLGIVAERLESAIARAGVAPHSFYALALPDSGFVIVTRLERTLADGTPTPGRTRFPTDGLSSGEVAPSPWAWVRSLVSAAPGFYRTVLFIVTPNAVRMGDRGLTQAGADSLLTGGDVGLPRSLVGVEMRGLKCTALIYEIEKRNAVDSARMVAPGRLQPAAHLLGAGYWTRAMWGTP